MIRGIPCNRCNRRNRSDFFTIFGVFEKYPYLCAVVLEGRHEEIKDAGWSSW